MYKAGPGSSAHEWLTGHGIGTAGLAVFVTAFFAMLNWHYPQVGHDYGQLYEFLAEGAWYFHRSGPAIPRYSVHLCGGSVMYGNPLDLFYSPLQALSFALDPWLAVQLVLLLAIVLGYVGWYRVGRDLLGMSTPWCHLLALVVQANGFHFMHSMAGHHSYHGFFLLGWLVLLIFERDRPLHVVDRIAKAAVFALWCAYLLYSANWFVLYFLGIIIVLVLPLDIFLAERPARRLIVMSGRLFLFGVAALALMASKLVAVQSYMRFAPRARPMISQDPSQSTLAYIMRALWAIPQNKNLLAQMPGWTHEKSMLIAPITAIGLVLAMGELRARVRDRRGGRKLALLSFTALYGGFLGTAMIQLPRGSGWLAEVFHRLPVAASQYVSTRYLYIFTLLVSVAAVWAVAQTMDRRGAAWKLLGMILAVGSTVVAFVVGYVDMLPQVELWTNVREHRARFRALDLSQPVRQVVPSLDLAAGTSRFCYDPILNDAHEPYLVLHEGPITDASDGYFNLMNPSCYQYPQENHCRPGDRISVEDADNLQRFASGQPTTWKISWGQYVADATSGVCLVGMAIFLRYAKIWRKRTRLAKPT